MVKSCGDNIRIGSNVRILGWEHLDVEYNISIHDNCYIDATGGLTLENNVSIAHSSSILTTNHGWSDTTLPIKYNPIKKSPVHIKSDVWVGCGCRILNGVTIYSRAVVAAGAVVNKDVEENSVYGGVPAKKIKDI
ncbi:acyltransferase [Patiriisocius hiemis]|uniref:Acyltransferase n=1 Tax=Patiriisocius hiemis TaxID=3075604 RepID=A0ABU2YEM9_9FLAO|nr:acyltransferase [Constantimarinum sp. W242]MDT0556642.1 acyltransferase [Constantimarinum sp. W242]